jgi:Secretion system C-terminal sorting domain
MKTLSLALFASLFTTVVLSQQFAPLGAKWTYTERYVFFEYADDISYSELTVTKDTIIQGRDCVEIEGASFCWFPEGLQYVSTSNDSVYFFDPLLDRFKLIYAFNTPPGGSWAIPILGWDGFIDTMTVTVDSVSTIEVNSHQLGVQYVTYYGKDYNENGLWDSLWYSSTIVETLGDLSFIFLFPENLSSVCDFNYSQGLRCYEDNFIGHYETGTAPSCKYTYVGLDEPKIGTLGLHPNPTSSKVYLETIPDNLKSIDLIDNLGKIVRKISIGEEIDLEGLANGVYFLRMVNVQNDFYIEKVIKYGS